MGKDSLNKPYNPIDIEKSVDLLSCITSDKSALYISVPLTTGTLFIKWYSGYGFRLNPQSEEYRESHYKNVFLPNSDYAKKKISELRRHFTLPVISPVTIERPEWTQDDYRYFWGRIIERYVCRIIMLDGWHYSSGCSFEFLMAVKSGILLMDENLQKIPVETGLSFIKKAINDISRYSLSTGYLERVAAELRAEINSNEGKDQENSNDVTPVIEMNTLPEKFYKDAILDNLAHIGNIAQFVSFSAGENAKQRYCRIHGYEPNHMFHSIKEAVAALFRNSIEGTLNVRTFKPDNPKGEPLHYALKDSDKILKIVYNNARAGKYSIVNETIDIHDGGVSGVALDGIMEFSPGDTPQCVDRKGICFLPKDIALTVLKNIYGFRPALNFPQNTRIEFSIHPKRRGLRKEHTIIWELEHTGTMDIKAAINWPNNFSKFLGDKLFGLLVADAIGISIPFTIAMNRFVAPFVFGRQTGTRETWLRTCPAVKEAGKFSTLYGWSDPFVLMQNEDPFHENEKKEFTVHSILAQQSIDGRYSGSSIPMANKQLHIEGVSGKGSDFMLGKKPPEKLPEEVIHAVMKINETASHYLGPVKIEWVYDGSIAWVVQLNTSEFTGSESEIYPGDASSFMKFDTGNGLEALRNVINNVKGGSTGIILAGDIGITSHMGDLLRSNKIPSRIQRHEKRV
ncbi:MAG: hypothetical protein JXB88_08170 [Spirochaetales bacterium]|nr:hypothetical protein [Spirochaetales bacterium]